LKVKAYVVSAFCKGGIGGNKAGVVLFNDALDGLNETQKRAISGSLGFAETAFVSQSGQADFKLEYFTPTEEVPLCGHATIAAFTLMQHLKIINKPEHMIETKSGLLSVSVDNDKIFMEQSKPLYSEILAISEFADCFDTDLISPQYLIQIVSTGLRDIMFPIRDENALNSINPNFEAISEVSRKYDVVGIHAFALQNGRIICRNFAPLYDIPEEAATGTANCALVSYLYKHGIMRGNTYTIEQGYSLNSPSEITVKLVTANGEVSRIFVGGSGQVTEEIEIDI
jgi:PhzF family phenazine biosynthesis protein